jgi:hypothetical protein
MIKKMYVILLILFFINVANDPVAFLIFILLTSLVIVSVFVGLKSKSMLFFGAFFLIRSMLGWLFSSKIIPYRQNMGGIQKTTQPCYKTEKKDPSEHIFREVYRRSQGK